VASTRCLAEPLSLILGARKTNACSGDRRKYNSLLRVLYDITDNPLAHAISTSFLHRHRRRQDGAWLWSVIGKNDENRLKSAQDEGSSGHSLYPFRILSG